MNLCSALILLSSLSATKSMVVATPATKSSSMAGAGGAGVHVPIGKDGDGEYTASTKGWYVRARVCMLVFVSCYPLLSVAR